MKQDSTIMVQINSLEFYQVVKQAIDAYWNDLQADNTPQDNFIEARDSIENYVREIKKEDKERNEEIDTLLKALEKSNSSELFK
jgi:5'-deoxynucleotidase YfbR-like HD superfamily hydrolase